MLKFILPLMMATSVHASGISLSVGQGPSGEAYDYVVQPVTVGRGSIKQVPRDAVRRLVILSYEGEQIYSTTTYDKLLIVAPEVAGRAWIVDGQADYSLTAGVVSRIRLIPEVAVEGGIGLTLLSDRYINSRYMGSYVHCTTWIGARFFASPLWSAQARFTHTSNASTGSVNPGINTFEIGLRYAF